MFTQDFWGNPEPLSIYLAKPDGSIIQCINDYINESDTKLTIGLNQEYELNFSVTYDPDKLGVLRDYFQEGMYLFVEKVGLFKISSPTSSIDGVKENKEITALSVDSELEDKNCTFPINMGTEESLEYLVEYDSNETELVVNPYTGIPYDWIVLYNTFPEQLDILKTLYNSGHFGTPDQQGDINVTNTTLISELEAWFSLVTRLPRRLIEHVETITYPDGSTEDITTYTLEEFAIINTNSSGETTSIILTNLFLGRINSLITFYTKYRNQLSLIPLVLEETGGAWTLGNIYGLSNGDYTLCNQKSQFDIDSTIYAFLTQDLAQSLECVINFDILNRKVNVTPAEVIGEDTGIVMAYDTLVNLLKIEPNDDDFSTRLFVSGGDDLGIEQVNFGLDWVDDITYKLNAKDSDGNRVYVSDALATKYLNFIDQREIYRQQYINYSKTYRNLQQQIYDIKYRVPDDGLKTDWGTFSEEDLEEELIRYKNTLAALISLYKSDYTPSGLNQDGSVNESFIRNTMYWGDYCAYKIIIDEIECAIATFPYYNDKSQWSAQNKTYYESKISAWETEWSLYGIIELEAKIETYKNNMDVFTENGSVLTYSSGIAIPWASLTSAQKDDYGGDENNYYYTDYERYRTLRASASSYLSTLKISLNSLQNQFDTVVQNRKTVSANAKVENNFTADELKLIYRLYKDADYNNENIITTSVDTTDEELDHSYELLQDAQDKAYIYGRPQLQFSIEADNLLGLKEFEPLWNSFVPGNYMLIQYKDDTYLRLRMVGYEFNPLLPSANSIEITFSNFIRSKVGVSDVESILGLSSGGSKSSRGSSGGSSGSSGDDIDTLSNTLLNKLLNSETFGTRVSNVILDTLDANSINAKRATFNGLKNGVTKIDGGCIQTGYLESLNYNGTIDSTVSPPVHGLDNTEGSIISMYDGTFSFAGGRLKYYIDDDDDYRFVLAADSITMGGEEVLTLSDKFEVDHTEYKYALWASGTEVPNPESVWQTTPVAPTSTMYAWTRTTVYYTSGDSTVTYTVGGKAGENGDSYPALSISSATIGKMDDGTYNPTSITVSGKRGLASYSGRFKIDTKTSTTSWANQYTSSSNESSYTYTITQTDIIAIRCSLYDAGGTTDLLDTQIIPIVSNGGKGEDAYTIILTNENHTFVGNETSAIPSSTDCSIIAYKGSTQKVATIGTITGCPTGMSTTITDNGTTNAKFTVSVLDTMVTQNGTLNVPITVDSKTFNMKFSYSLTLKGSKGDKGDDGTAYKLIVSAAAISKKKNGSYSPTSISLSSQKQDSSATGGISNYSGRFTIDTTTDNTNWTNQYTSSSNESSHSYNIPSGITAVRCSLYQAGGTTVLLDTQIVPVVSDGEDAYTVILSNESHTFPAGESAAVSGSTATSNIVTYKGATQVSCYVGSSSSATSINTGITGLTCSISNNNSTNVSLTFTAGDGTLTTRSGVVNIPVVVDGKSFTKQFAFTLALSGAKGEQGTGVTITSTSVTYQSSSSGTTIPTGTWSTSIPSVSQGYYLWTQTIVNYSDGTSTTSYSKARQGVNGTDITSQYMYWDSNTSSTYYGLNIKYTNFNNRLHMNANGVHIYGGNDKKSASFTSDGISFYGNNGTSVVASFKTSGAQIGDAKFDSTGFYISDHTKFTSTRIELGGDHTVISLARSMLISTFIGAPYTHVDIMPDAEDSYPLNYYIDTGEWPNSNFGSTSVYITPKTGTDPDYRGGVMVSGDLFQVIDNSKTNANFMLSCDTTNHIMKTGLGTTAAYANQTVIGKYNYNNSDTAFEIGWGTSTSNRLNLMNVFTGGNIGIRGDITTIDGATVKYAASSHNHAASAITSGTLAIARIPTGTTSTTVALGNHTHSGYVPTTRTVNSKALSANITLSASDVSAVPTTRTVNGKALSSNITLSASDVGAAASSHNHTELKSSNFSVMIRGSSSKIFGPDASYTEDVYLGGASYRWKTVYATNGTINTSDLKQKDIIGDIDFAEDLIMSLEPTVFMWKDGDHRRKRMGFIAQDVAKECQKLGQNLSLYTASYTLDDELYEVDYFGEDVDDKRLIWGLSYDQLIAPIVAVIQNQNKRIEELEKKISER